MISKWVKICSVVVRGWGRQRRRVGQVLIIRYINFRSSGVLLNSSFIELYIMFFYYILLQVKKPRLKISEFVTNIYIEEKKKNTIVTRLVSGNLFRLDDVKYCFLSSSWKFWCMTSSINCRILHLWHSFQKSSIEIIFRGYENVHYLNTRWRHKTRLTTGMC